MEDYRRLLHTHAPLLLASAPGKPLLHPTMIKAWGRLRRFAENHTKHHDGETLPVRQARIKSENANIHSYATECVKVSCNVV